MGRIGMDFSLVHKDVAYIASEFVNFSKSKFHLVHKDVALSRTKIFYKY